MTFLLTWHRCILILIFPNNIIFCFHAAIPLDTGIKKNVYKTYVRSVYALFPRGCDRASKFVLLNKSFQITTCSKENQYLYRPYKNYYYLWKSNISIINLSAGFRNMIKLSKKYDLLNNHKRQGSFSPNTGNILVVFIAFE